MSDITLSVAKKQQYFDGVKLLWEQDHSYLRNHVDVMQVKGKSTDLDIIGGVELQEIVGTHQNTPEAEIEHTLRRLSLQFFSQQLQLDLDDTVETITNFGSRYVQRLGAAAGRKQDEIIIDALVGTAYGGDAGVTPIALPSAQKIDTAGATALTVDKLRQAKRMFEENEFFGGLKCALSPKGKEDLLATTEVTSSDYNTVKALVNGELNTFMGMEFIATNMIPHISSGAIDRAIVFAPDAVRLGMGMEPKVRVGEDPRRNYMDTFFIMLGLGAVRTADNHVVEIGFDIS